ncbi:Pentatricopeptide repeat [Dillenia turbinata]|uniref:Pentatricopeptide repeat n=1 Tax=Dillenia turbinata TaxID=194707 RepID=A0AAN8VUW1_9MAGN
MFAKWKNTITHFSRYSITKPITISTQIAQKHNLVTLLKKCSTLEDLRYIYASLIKNNGVQDCYLINQFIGACAALGRTDYAILAHTQMEKPNVFVYNAMIRCFVYCNSPFRALELYVHMLRAQVSPTSFTFSSLVKACRMVFACRFGQSIHTHIWKNGYESHVFVLTTLIDLYSDLGRIVDCQRVFDEMPERDVFAWTTMISVYARVGNLYLARRLFEEMPERNTASWNTIIDGYARVGDLESAELLFSQMATRDLISWTTMINCYSQNKQFNLALATFDEMRKYGIRADEVTMTTVISACAHLGALELGKEIHLYIMENGFYLDVYVGSALVDMYAKCGSLDRSLVVFFKLQEKNLFCWNSIIEALASHGHADEALSMFTRMEREKVRPNGVTFVSLLSACTHAGLVEEGRRRFLSMTSNYSISPETSHYGCMVDLLSRAGLLDEALELIRRMEIEPNSVIWGAILGGCKLHKNLEIAQLAVNKLLQLEPNNSGYYTLLLNMYAEANRWSDVLKIRSTMKELGVEKTCPGSSWIEIKRKIHQFVAADESHGVSDEIHNLLIELNWQLKLANYLPELGLE